MDKSIDYVQQTQKVLSRYLPLIVVGIVAMIAISYFSGSQDSNALLRIGIMMIIGLVFILLHQINQYELNLWFAVISQAIYANFFAFTSKSALFHLSLVMGMILATFLRDFVLHILFIVNTFFVLLYLHLGIYTPEYVFMNGLPLANTIQVLLPTTTITYFFLVLIRSIITKSIEVQQEQLEELKKTQEVLVSQAKIQTIKTIVGGMTHDFNNALTFILGYVDIMEVDPEFPEHLRSQMDDLKLAVDNARAQASEMVNIVKMEEITNTAITDIPEMLKASALLVLRGKSTTISYNIDNNLYPIFASRNLIHQIILNLLINAVQAMDRSGEIHIRAYNIELYPQNAYKLSEGKYIKVHITDSGPGVTKAFDPFELFSTTKESGSGIGLAISRKIIETYNGYIDYLNTDTGADFFFLIPAIN